jgi:hypothetical protein
MLLLLLLLRQVRWSKLMWSASVSSNRLSATFMRTSKDGESGSATLISTLTWTETTNYIPCL